MVQAKRHTRKDYFTIKEHIIDHILDDELKQSVIELLSMNEEIERQLSYIHTSYILMVQCKRFNKKICALMKNVIQDLSGKFEKNRYMIHCIISTV